MLWRGIAALVLTAAAMLYLSLTSGTWLISPDSTDYIEGARSLARLEGFRDAQGVPETLIPPGASAVYAIAAVVPATDYFSFNLLTKVLALAFLVLTYLVARRSVGEGPALIVVVFLALGERLLFESTRILSDIPFSVAFMLTLWLFPEDKLDSLSGRAALALGAMVAICYAIRTAGLFVLLGYATWLAWRGGPRRVKTIALISSVFVLVAGALWLRSRVEGATHSYFQLIFLRRPWVLDSGFPSLSDWYDRITVNTATTLRQVYVGFANDYRLVPAGVVACLLMTAGAVSNLARRRALLSICLLASYAPALVLPPYTPDPRYLLPILPLLALLAAEGARAVSRFRFAGQHPRLAWAALAAIIAINPYWTNGYATAAGLRAELQRARGRAVLYRGHEPFVELVERERSRLTPADSVATMHANILRYFLPAGTRVWSYRLTEDPAVLYGELIAGGATVLYCDRAAENWRYLAPVIRTYPERFRLEAENRAAAIYRVLR